MYIPHPRPHGTERGCVRLKVAISTYYLQFSIF